MNQYIQNNYELGRNKGEIILAPFSRDENSDSDSFANLVTVRRYCPSCDDINKATRNLTVGGFSYNNAVTFDNSTIGTILKNNPHLDDVDIVECTSTSSNQIEALNCIALKEKAYAAAEGNTGKEKDDCNWLQKLFGKCSDSKINAGSINNAGSVLSNIGNWLTSITGGVSTNANNGFNNYDSDTETGGKGYGWFAVIGVALIGTIVVLAAKTKKAEGDK